MRRGATLVTVVIGFLACAALGGASTRSFPPPGRIVYSGAAAAEAGLFVAGPDGSSATQITSGPDDFSPPWSPDDPHELAPCALAGDWHC